jgi:PHP family Zn ribbon phosphoesterase
MTPTYVVTRVVLRACILCGEQEWNAAGDAQRELTEAEAVTERNARCARCGGSLVVEVASRRVRLEPEIDWRADQKHRGRPSNALRALRKAISTEEGIVNR